MSKKDSRIIDDIIHFIETERELFGDFSVNINSVESIADNYSASDDVSDKASLSDNKKTSKKNFNQDSGSNFSNQKTKSEWKKALEACHTLEELYELCLISDDLKTDLEGTNLVFGTGNPTADLMLIGEAPGEQEDLQGEPFVGRAGQLLNKILKAINFDRSDVYIANILKHRPPGNRDPLPEERNRSLPYLYRQIDIISPKLILCLGKVSATTLLNRDEYLRDLRGKFHPFRNTELMVTYHPAALLRNTQWKRPAWEDVQRLRERYDELGCSP
ncbi:MAG: uracil-DNA glycosylase family protein [Balneolaceae bacterium]